MSAIKLTTLRGEPYHREQLINVPALIIMIVVLTVVLVLLFPKKAVFSDPAYLHAPDALSIAYLKLLLKSDPGNTELRLSLARQLYVTGQLKQAMSAINLLVAHAPAGYQTQIYNLNVKLIAQQYFAHRDTAGKTLLLDLQAAFQQAVAAANTPAELKVVYNMAKNWATPSIQLRIVRKIIDQIRAPQQKVAWLLTAADLSLAQNRPTTAANWLEQAYNASLRSKPALAARILRTLLATGNPDNALQRTPYYVHRHPHSKNLLQLAISIAQQTGRQEMVDHWLTRATQLEPDNMDYNRRLMKLKLATGQLQAAALLADIRLQHPGLSTAERTRIAHLYEWNGQPGKALKQWYWLSMHAPHADEEARQRALKLAIGLFHYRQATRLYEHIASQRPLQLAEQKALTGLYLMAGQSAKVEKSYRHFLQQHPQNKSIWSALAGLYVSEHRLPQAATAYESIDKKFGLSEKQLLDLKNIYWLLDEPERAHKLLLAYAGTADKMDSAYWKARAEMAWYLEDTDNIDGIYHFLLAGNHKQAIDASMLNQLMALYAAGNNDKKSTRLAILGWQRLHKADYAIKALSYASQSGDWALASRVAEQIKATPHAQVLKKNSHYWQLLANIARHRQQFPQAIAYLQQATLLSPDNSQLELSLLWLLIEQHKEKNPRLRTALLSSIQRFGQNPYLLDAQAAAWSALGQYDMAVRWYRQSLPAHQQDWPWLLDYAYALQQNGQTLAAWRVRRYTLAWMQQHPESNTKIATGRDWTSSYLSLVREFAGKAVGWKMAGVLFKDKTSRFIKNSQTQQKRLTLFTEWALADHHQSLATAIQARATRQQLKLPDWQQLGLAMQQYDTGTIEKLLANSQSLPLADRTLALAENGYHARALNFGLTHLSAKASYDDQQQLRAAVASIRSQQPNGIKLGLLAEGIGDIHFSGPQLHYAHASDYGITLIDAHSFNTSGQQSLVSQWPQENRLRLSQRWLNRAGSQTLHLGLDERVKGSQIELAYEQTFPIYSGMNIGFAAGLQQRSKISASAYELLNWNHLDLRNDYQWDSRSSLATQLRWNYYDSIWGDFLGQGFDLDINLNHIVFANAPQWLLHSDIQWTHTNTVDKLPADFSPYFTTPNPDINTVLTRRFGRIGIGTTLQHGTPGIIAHQRASPHWLLDLDAGFQWTSGRFDWAVNSGFGWRLFGDDELALTARYSSDTRGAGSTYQLWLGYNKYIGR